MLLPIPEDILQAQARERTIDLLLASMGVSAAVVAASFAAYMVVTHPGGGSDRGRVVAASRGATHLPLKTPEAARDAADDLGQALDFTPTGTVATPTGARPGRPARTAAMPDFAVRDVFDDTALVEAHGTLQVVRPGSVIAGAGEVLSIARRGSGWAVVTEGGTIEQRR
jgi:hypothetical protein